MPMIDFDPAREFSGDTYHLVPEPGSDRLCVFFTATGAPARQFQFWKVGPELACHRLFVNNGENEWYQSGIPGLGADMAETLDSIRRIADRLGVSGLFTCGGSMGGHGAILYGAQLGARVMAFAPETLLGMANSRCERLMHPEAVIRHPDLTPFIEAARQPIFMYVGERDPVDVYRGRHVRDLANITVKSLRRVGHGPASFLHNRGLLIPLLRAFLDNKPLPAMEEEGRVLWIEGFPELFYRTHCHFERREWEMAVETGRQALAAFPVSAHGLFMVGKSLLSLGREPEALPVLAMAANLLPSMADYHFLQGHCLRRMGYPAEAAILHRQTIKTWPGHAKAHYCLGLCLEMLGDRNRAIQEFERAASLDPTQPGFQKRLAEIARQRKILAGAAPV